MLDQRGRLLVAALGFAALEPREPEMQLLHRWLDCWRGVGDVVTGMNRQGYWLHLSNIDTSTWRATFSREAMISADGFDVGETPWRGTAGGMDGAHSTGENNPTLCLE